MKQLYILTIALGLVLAVSCGPGKSDAGKDQADSVRARKIRNAKPDKEQFKSQIRIAEQKMKSSSTFDPQVAGAAIKAYLDYATVYPDDTITPDYYFRSAGLATAVGNYDQAIVLYAAIADKYPEYKYVVEAIYQEAMIYDSNLPGQDPKAKVLYEKIIHDYPKHKLAGDSKDAIRNLGKSDEELIKEFEKKNKQH